MTAFYWFVLAIVAAYAVVIGLLYEGNRQSLAASRRLTKVLGDGLRLAHEAHATDNTINYKREQAFRAVIIRIDALLESALAARFYGDIPATWDKHWKDIEEARSLSAVFPARDL